MTQQNQTNEDTCYIFGNGADIKYYDLNYFKNTKNLFCNHMSVHKDFEKINNHAYFWMDSFSLYPIIVPNFLKMEKKIYNKIKINLFKKLIRPRNIKTNFFFSHYSNFLSFANKKLSLISEKELQKLTNFEFRDIKLIKSTFFCMLLKAYQIGFKKFYLIGFDYLKTKPTLGHFYEQKIFENLTIEDSYKNNVEKLLNFLFKKKIEITGIFPNTQKSEFLPYISYEQFFKTKEIYKENHHLIKSNDLELYKIISRKYKFNYKI